MSNGIKLGLDSDGNSIIIQEENKKQKCVAGVFCEYVQETICNYKKNALNIFHIKRCPINKWRTYQYVRTQLEKRTGCYCCGGNKQWRNKEKWICESCHPPPFKRVERRIHEY